MAHGSYRPPWREKKEDKKKQELILRYEIRDASKTLRYCSNCGEFSHFNYSQTDINYLYFHCPKCKEEIKINRIKNKNDFRKWS